MIIIAALIITIISCLLLLGWWCTKMREVFLLNKRIQRIRDADGKVTFVYRKNRKPRI